jgi:GMP synthase (glutamine-hydrolysing)
VLALPEPPSTASLARAGEAINRVRGINRVVSVVDARLPLERMHLHPGYLAPERLSRLRRADAIVRRLSHDSGFDRQAWQFPVVLIPVGGESWPDSVVLRPIDSVDGMTAQAIVMEEGLLQEISRELMAIEGLCAVFYDLTHKPPATIEWE